MGAYQIFKIEFKNKESRDMFESCGKYISIKNPKRLFQYESCGEYDCVYYMGWDGYALANVCLEYMDKIGMLDKIRKFRAIDLTCGTNWCDELRWYKKNKMETNTK